MTIRAGHAAAFVAVVALSAWAASATTHGVGVVRPYSIQLLTNDVSMDAISGYSTSPGEWQLESPATTQTLPWAEKWNDAKIRICFYRYSDEAYHHDSSMWDAGLFDISGVGMYKNGDFTAYVKYMDSNEQQLHYAVGEDGQKCLDFDVQGSGSNAAANCANGGSAQSYDIWVGGNVFQWGCPGATGFSGDDTELPSAADGTPEDTIAYCENYVLGGFTAIDLQLTPVDFSNTVSFKAPYDLYTEGTNAADGILLSFEQQYESQAKFALEITRECAGPLTGSEGTDFWPGSSPFSYFLKFNEGSSVAPGNLRMDCDNHDCVCYTDGGGAQSCDLKLEQLPLTLSTGYNWANQTVVGNPIEYQETDIGYEIQFDAWRCGSANRKRLRLSAFVDSVTSDHMHIGKLELSQKASGPSTVCQPTIASNALTELVFTTLDDDFDANRPAQETSATGDFTTTHTSIVHDASAGTYSLTIGGRIPTAQQYSEGNFQVFATVVGTGNKYDLDGTNGYEFDTLADGDTKKVCINWPANYWSTSSYANSNEWDTQDEYHQKLFNSYTFPNTGVLDDVIAQANNGYPGDGIYEYNTNAANNDAYRLMPIRMVSGNVVKDAYITKTGDNYYAAWEFEGTLDEFKNCVAPGTGSADDRSSVVSVTNAGDENLDDVNIKYEFTVYHQRITYRGSRNGGGTATYLWATSVDDLVHSLTYQITINADSGAMVTSEAATLDTSASVVYAAYEACDGNGESDATYGKLSSNHNGGGEEDTADRRLQIVLRVLLAKNTSPETRDIGVTDSTAKFSTGVGATAYWDSALDGYKLIDVTYGLADGADSDEVVTEGGQDYNVFYLTYQTGCYSTYNSGVGDFVTDTFSSATENPSTFDVDLVLQRVKTGANAGGAWEDGFTSSYDAADTADDSTLHLKIDIPFDHSPVAIIQATSLFAHDFEVEMAISNNARENQGCTSGAQCEPYDSTERMNLPQTGKVSFLARTKSTYAVPTSVTSHIREFVVCELNLSPYSGCIGEPSSGSHSCNGDSDGYGVTHNYYNAPTTTAHDFGLLGSWTLENKCSKALWTAWLLTKNLPAGVSGGGSPPSYEVAYGATALEGDSDVGGGYLNPIKGEWTYAHNYGSLDVYKPDDSILEGSSVLCRADDDDVGTDRDAKSVNRYAGHGAWACDAGANSYGTQCVYETTWKPSSGNLNLYDAITIDMSVLPIGAELRSEVTMALHECTSGAARLLRGTASSGTMHAQAKARHARALSVAGDVMAITGRALSPVRVSALSVGVNSSMIGFYIDEVSYDDGSADDSGVLSSGIPLFVVVLILVGVLAAGLLLLFALHRCRREDYPPATKRRRYAAVSTRQRRGVKYDDETPRSSSENEGFVTVH